MSRFATAALAAVLFLPREGSGQPIVLTLDDALARARERAPAILTARTQIDDARGRLAGASLWLPENPVIDGAAGSRFSANENLFEADVAIGQALGTWGRRQARIAVAEAGVEAAEATTAETARLVVHDVATAFLEALAAEQRYQLAVDMESVARDLQRVTARRHAAGDLPILDVNLARGAAARSIADTQVADADRLVRLDALRVLLGLDPEQPLAVRGALFTPRRFDLPTLVVEALKRPDLQSAAANLRQAEAEVRLADTFERPDFGVAASYARDDGDDVVLGGVRVSLPLVARGQELRATGLARAQRARIEVEAMERALRSAVRSAFEAYERQCDAVRAFEGETQAGLEENESLARRSYEAGHISLPELLLIRRETQEARRAYLDHLRSAAMAALELQRRAGVLR